MSVRFTQTEAADLLAVCAWCKNIRDPREPQHWLPAERFHARLAQAGCTHGICPACLDKLLRPLDGLISG